MTADEPLRICIAGASGRMGHMLIEAVLAADDCVLSGAMDIASSAAIGTDATADPTPNATANAPTRPT